MSLPIQFHHVKSVLMLEIPMQSSQTLCLNGARELITMILFLAEKNKVGVNHQSLFLQ